MPDAIHQTTLANGLRVVLQRVEGSSGVGVSVNYRVGFRTETPGRSGFAHLFEHMMFQGSRNTERGGHFVAVQKLGGSVNANTFPDSTDYYQLVPDAALEKILQLEADRMDSLAVTEENFAVQRKVVREEIRLQMTAKPYGGFPWTVLPELMFDKWENAHNGYGELSDLEAASVDDCADFYSRYYGPGNAVLALCGDVDPEAALAAVHRSFDGISARPVPDPPDLFEPARPDERRGTHTDPHAPRPALAIGSRLPDARRDLAGYSAHVVLAHLLTTGGHARLKGPLARRGTTIDCATGYFGPLAVADPDTFVFVARHPSGEARGVEEFLVRELTEVAEGAAHGAETRRAVACARSALYQSLDSPATRARALARGALLFGRADIGETLAGHIARTTGEDVATAAARAAVPAGRAVLNLVPQGSAS